MEADRGHLLVWCRLAPDLVDFEEANAEPRWFVKFVTKNRTDIALRNLQISSQNADTLLLLFY